MAISPRSPAQIIDLGLFGSDTCLGFDNFLVEQGLSINRKDVFLTDAAGILFEPFEFVDDVLRPAGAVDRPGSRWRRSA